MIIGNAQRDLSTSTIELELDTVRAGVWASPADQLLSKLSALMDGLGSGTGGQRVRGVAYTSTGHLIGASDELIVADGQGASWVDFAFAEPVRVADAGNLTLGLHSGQADRSARLYALPATTAGKRAADTYADGPANPLPATTAGLVPAIFATALPPYAAPDAADDWYLGLPPDQAAAVFGSTAPDTSIKPISARLSWHGERIDPNRGAYALANAGGPIAPYVGERLRITYRHRSVDCYCAAEANLLDDLTVPRRLFMDLALPSVETAPVRVEVLS